MRARTVRVDRWEKTPTRTAQDKIKIKNPGRQQPCWGSLFCTNLTQPTGNLDSKSGGEVMELLQNVWKKMGKALVVITHDSRIARMADRQFQIVDGVLTEVTAK